MGDFALPAADIVEMTIDALGYDLVENGEIEAAIRYYRVALELDPESINTAASCGVFFADGIVLRLKRRIGRYMS